MTTSDDPHEPVKTFTADSSWLPFWLLLIFVAVGGFFGYQQLFSTFASYDDEGYVMLSLQNVMEGRPLYDETYSQYGPAFFQIQGFLHDIFDLEISHDVVRYKTLCGWLLISLLSAASIWRITRSAWFGVATFGLVFPHLDRLCLEPGHPQELCGLCLMGIILLAAILDPPKLKDGNSKRKVEFAAIGGIIAVTLLTKINVGLILAAPIVLAMLLCSRKSLGTTLLLTLATTASFGFLGLIAYQGGLTSASLALPTVIAIGLIAAMLSGMKFKPEQQVHGRQIICALVGLLVAMIGIVTIAVLQRTSLAGLADGIVLQHMGFGDFFFSPAPLHPLVITGAIVGLTLAGFTSFGFGRAATIGRLLLTLLLFCSATTALTQSFTVPQVGFDDRGMAGLLVSFATGLCWVILVPIRPEATHNQTAGFGRMALCFTAIFQPAIAYPTPGTQMAVGSVLLLLVAVIAFYDLSVGGLEMQASRSELSRCVLPAGILCLIVMSTMVIRDFEIAANRSNMSYLGLPGTERLRLPEKEVAAIQSVVEKLNRESDTFIFAENSRNSLYFWTRKKPPTAINATAWPYMLNSDQQKRIVESLGNYDRVLVVRDRFKWPLPEHAPLSEWIDSNFAFDSTKGHFDIWARKSDADSVPRVIRETRADIHD